MPTFLLHKNMPYLFTQNIQELNPKHTNKHTGTKSRAQCTPQLSIISGRKIQSIQTNIQELNPEHNAHHNCQLSVVESAGPPGTIIQPSRVNRRRFTLRRRGGGGGGGGEEAEGEAGVRRSCASKLTDS
jgi:hypothetical protein